MGQSILHLGLQGMAAFGRPVGQGGNLETGGGVQKALRRASKGHPKVIQKALEGLTASENMYRKQNGNYTRGRPAQNEEIQRGRPR